MSYSRVGCEVSLRFACQFFDIVPTGRGLATPLACRTRRCCAVEVPLTTDQRAEHLISAILDTSRLSACRPTLSVIRVLAC